MEVELLKIAMIFIKNGNIAQSTTKQNLTIEVAMVEFQYIQQCQLILCISDYFFDLLFEDLIGWMPSL